MKQFQADSCQLGLNTTTKSILLSRTECTQQIFVKTKVRELATGFIVGLIFISRWTALHSVKKYTLLVVVVVILVISKVVIAVWLAILISQL